jgi:hypothetical protein
MQLIVFSAVLFFIRCSSSSRVSKKTHYGPVYIYLPVSLSRFFPEDRQPAWPGVVVAQQWEPVIIPIVISIVTDVPNVIVILGLAFAGLDTPHVEDALVQSR